MVLLAGGPSPALAEVDAQRQQLSSALREAMLAGNYALARDRGAAYIQYLEQTLGRDSADLITPLANVAAALVELGDYAGASANLTRALALLDRQSPDKPLARARMLTLQGRALIRDGRPAEAGVPLRRAAKIVEADPAIDAQTRAQVYEALLDSMVAPGAAANAPGLERFVFEGNAVAKSEIAALESQFGQDTARLGQALAGPARWYRYSNQIKEERGLHQRAIRLIEKEGGPRDTRLGEPLRGLASLGLIEHRQRAEADQALNQAMGLQYDTSARSALALAETAALRADVELVFGSPAGAQQGYIDAWQAIARHPELGAAVADRYFGAPMRLHAEPDWTRKGGTTDSRLRADTGTVLITFTVTSLGTADNVQVASATANTDWDETLRNGVAEIRYRPRMAGGKPVATPEMEISWSFR